MKDDLNNQKALTLAQEADPNGIRTIGILTKPDTLQSGETEEWVKVFKNRKEVLHHGYYITRQPSATQLVGGITFDQARDNEKAFFEATAPWSKLSPRWKERMGTEKLSAALSDCLLAFIGQKLPSLVEQINIQYNGISTALTELGDPPSNNYQGDMIYMIDTFTTGVQHCADGRSGYETFLQDVMASYEHFRAEVWATAPRFLPFTKSQLNATPKGAGSVGDIDEIKDERLGTSGKKGKEMDLDDVRQHIKRSITRELPNNIPFPAKAALIKLFLSTWKRLSQDLVLAVRPLLDAVLDIMVDEVFGRYKERHLSEAVRASIEEQLKILSENTQTLVLKLVELENRPFTMNDHYLVDVRNKVLAQLKARRQSSTAGSATPQQVNGGCISRSSLDKGSSTVDGASNVAPGHIAPFPAFSFNPAQEKSPAGPLPLAASFPKTPNSDDVSPRPVAPIPKLSNTPQNAAASHVVAPAPPTPLPSRGLSSASPDPVDREAKIRDLLAQLALAGYTGLKEDDLDRLRPTDEYETELEVMAEARAYWQVAYKRIIDNVPRIIDAEFIIPAAKAFRQALVRDLGVFHPEGSQRCQAYLAESGEVARHRADLMQRKERLEKAKRVVKDFRIL